MGPTKGNRQSSYYSENELMWLAEPANAAFNKR